MNSLHRISRITLFLFATCIWLWEIPEHETGDCYVGQLPLFWIQRLVNVLSSPDIFTR